MNINFKATSILLTEAIRDYAEKRIEAAGRLFGEEKDTVTVDVELSQTTKHHKAGNIFRTEITLRYGSRRFRAVSVKDDLYASIDDAKEELEREIVTKKERSQTLFRRGSQQVKNILKGISGIPRKLRRSKS
jgi:ribosomal subunit interface protein